MKMNKKVLLSAAASAALLLGGIGADKAQAADSKREYVSVHTIKIGDAHKLFNHYIGFQSVLSANQCYELTGMLRELAAQSKIVIEKKQIAVTNKKQTETTAVPEAKPAAPADKQTQTQAPVQQPAEKAEQKTQAQPKPVTEKKQEPAKTPEKAVKEEQPVQKPAEQKPAEKEEKAEAAPVQTPSASQNGNSSESAEKPAQSAASSEVSEFERQVVELTNAERAKQGLKALTLDNELSRVAGIKSQDMKDKNYFDHTSPTYGSPFDMMKSFGISYKAAGENIAMGQTTPQQVVQAWMNSEGHRANIMNANFTHIGVGHVASGNYWTQMFIGK